ncbi:MAG: hypothetical protein AAGH68_13690 [Pseudomonadota bacterium]
MMKTTNSSDPTAIADADLDAAQGGLGPGGLSHERAGVHAGLRSDGELVQAVSDPAHSGKTSEAKNNKTGEAAASGEANTIGVWDMVSP